VWAVVDRPFHAHTARHTEDPMHSFADNTGQSWTLHITAAAMARLRDVAAIDLLAQPADEDDDAAHAERFRRLWAALLTDPDVVTRGLVAACQPQIQERGLTDEQFAERLDAEQLRQAADCMADELTAFFLAWAPPHGRALQKTLAILRTFLDKTDALVKTRLDAIDTEAEAARISREVATQLGPPLGN